MLRFWDKNPHIISTYDATADKPGPVPEGRKLGHKKKKEKRLQNYSLKLEGLQHCYLLCSIS